MRVEQHSYCHRLKDPYCYHLVNVNSVRYVKTSKKMATFLFTFANVFFLIFFSHKNAFLTFFPNVYDNCGISRPIQCIRAAHCGDAWFGTQTCAIYDLQSQAFRLWSRQLNSTELDSLDWAYIGVDLSLRLPPLRGDTMANSPLHFPSFLLPFLPFLFHPLEVDPWNVGV